MKKIRHPLSIYTAGLILLAQASSALCQDSTLANQSWALRHADGLLHSTNLQAVVEAQTKRDADALRPFFTDPDPLVRARAAFGAGSVQDSALVEPLEKLLSDPDPRVRVDAAFGLRQTEGANPQNLYRHFKTEKDDVVRAMLLGALGFRGEQAQYQALFSQKIQNLEVAHILCAIYFLQRDIHTGEGIQTILNLLDHKNVEVREHAAYFFYVLKRRKVSEPGLADQLVKRVKASSYDELSSPYLLRYIASEGREKDIDLLLDWSLNGKSIRAQSVALEGLGLFLIQHQRVREVLIEATTNPHLHMSDTAAELLAASDAVTEMNLAAIRDLLKTGKVNPTSRPHLLSLLWKKNDRKLVREMIKQIPDEKELELITALSVALEIDSEIIENRLPKLIRSTNPQVSMLTGIYLAQRMGLLTDAVSLHLFETFIREVPDSKVRSAALFELAEALDSSKEVLDLFPDYYEAFLKQKDWPSAASSLLILGSSRSPQVKATIEKALKHPEELVRTAATGALTYLAHGLDKPINHGELDFAPVLKMDWDFLKKYGRHPKLVYTTRLGDIVIELDTEQAPMGAQNLIAHTEKGTFNGLHVYRHVPNHVIQFGPQGHFGYRIVSEFTRIPKEEHTFGIGDYGKDTASQHIAITHLMRPHNEGKYTNLGLVVKGRDIPKHIDKYDLIIKARVIPDASSK